MKFIEKNLELYEKNIAAVKENKNLISNIINNAKIDENLMVYEIDGATCFSYKHEDKEIHISNLGNQEQVAHEILDSQYENEAEKIDLYTYGALFILDPYLLKAFFNKYKWYRHVYTIFPSISYFNTLLYYFDFTQLLINEAFKPLAFSDIYTLEMNIYMNLAYSGFSSNGIKIFAYHPFALIAQEVLNKALNIIVEVSRTEQSNVSTMMLFGRDFAENDLRSIDKFIKYPDISSLARTNVGKPIICVAAGPSLQKNIGLLKEIQNEVFIIAVSAVLKPLLAYGIKPDLVTTLDMHHEIQRYLEGLDLKDLRIAVEMSCYFGVMENMPANYIISVASTTGRTYLSRLLEDLDIRIKDEEKISGAMTVAFMSVLIANLMGASEVILLGQDLAFEEFTHIPGATFSNKLNIFQENGQDYFHFDFLGLQKDAVVPVVWIKGYNKERVPTTPQFDIYRQFIERMIIGRKLKIVNSTEGGAFIKGTEHISLQESYDKYIKNKDCNKNINAPFRREFDFTTLKATVDKLQVRLNKFREMLTIAHEGITSIEQFEELRKNKQDIVEKELVTKLSVSINGKITSLQQNYGPEVDFLTQNFPIEHYLSRYIDNSNQTKHNQTDIITDMKNKSILMLSSLKKNSEFAINEFERMIDRIKNEYPQYLQK